MSAEHCWNDTDGGETEPQREYPVPVQLRAPQMLHRLTWDRTMAGC